MFFIMGINQTEKQLPFDQLEVCSCCGQYGHLQVFVRYTYLMLFFIPVFKWGKQYTVRMSCCNSSTRVPDSLGRAMERREIAKIPLESLHFEHQGYRGKTCGFCGFTTKEDFQFCPKCGREF